MVRECSEGMHCRLLFSYFHIKSSTINAATSLRLRFLARRDWKEDIHYLLRNFLQQPNQIENRYSWLGLRVNLIREKVLPWLSHLYSSQRHPKLRHEPKSPSRFLFLLQFPKKPSSTSFFHFRVSAAVPFSVFESPLASSLIGQYDLLLLSYNNKKGFLTQV